jgi:TM2 domain-containing membrane protein YozV
MEDPTLTEVSNRKLAAGLLAIFLGSFGVHKFVLGYTKQGLILLAITLLSCGIAGFVTGVIGLVEGIIYLTKTPEEFKEQYLVRRRLWF